MTLKVTAIDRENKVITLEGVPDATGIPYFCEAAQYSHSGSWGLSREGPPLRMGETFETDDITDLMGDAAGMRAKIMQRHQSDAIQWLDRQPPDWAKR